MTRKTPDPHLVRSDGSSRSLQRFPRSHSEFDEEFLQELLSKHPELLPVAELREDVGELLCIGREVRCGGSGMIDNLYMSTGGYPVVVETKLWRNPQARREVLSQVLDYTKEIVNLDFEWFEAQWQQFSSERSGGASESLVAKLSVLAEDELDEPHFIDRVHRALRRGDILSLIVGDGIETRLEQLVSHLARDSAHLRYSLALVELACYKTGEDGESGELLVVPRIVQNVDPVERAYVRVELAPEIESQLVIKSVIEPEGKPSGKPKRTLLTEDDLLANLDDAVGTEVRQEVERFYRELVDELGLEAEFRSSALMIKIPDPAGDRPGASVLAVERQGRIYNPEFLPNQLFRMGLERAYADSIASDYWNVLNRIDDRFGIEGISIFAPTGFIPVRDLVPKFGAIREEIARVVESAREALGKL